MTVALALLTLLEATGASHGFALKKRYDTLLGQSQELRFGQVYATLARLERDGLAAGVGLEHHGGPERKLYAVTASGLAEVNTWLRTTAVPGGRPTELFTKVVLALISGRPAGQILDAQREIHLQRMREITQARNDGDVIERLAGDFEMLHLEADLKWVTLAGQRLDLLAEEVNGMQRDVQGQSS